MSEQTKHKFPIKSLSIILNILLLGAILALLILKGGQPQHQEFDAEKAETAADEAVEQHQHGEEASSGDGKVAMDDRQIKLNGIELLAARPARIRSILQTVGEIHVNADKSVHVVPRLPGIVETVHANAGDQVKKGQVLAVISSQAIAEQRSELLGAEKRVELARLTYEREKRLWEEKISAEQDYQQARQTLQEAEIALQQARQKLQVLGAQAGGNLARYEIRSPINGVITEKQIAAGQVLSGSENLFVVADLSTIWAEMRIYPKDIEMVKVGQSVTVKAPSMELHATGKVSYVGALVGEESRTAMARVVLPNPDQQWRPGLPVNIELSSEEVEVPLAISVEGLQELEGETVAFVREGQIFQVRQVKLGQRDAHYAEVLEGIQPGEHYAAENSYLIKAELGKAHAEHEH
jgi:cobalt-zinc-cadmium efflux system membrane fusion protein